MKKLPPLASSCGLLGHIPELQKDRMKLFEKCFEECGDIGRLRFGPFNIYMVFHPELVKEVLQKQADNFLRETRGYQNIRAILGRGLVTSEGDIWRKQRQQANKYFSPQRIAQMVPTMNEVVKRRVAEWDTGLNQSSGFDLYEEMAQLNLLLFDACYLNGMLGRRMGDIYQSQVFFSNYLFKRATRILSWPLWIPVRESRLYHENIKSVRAIMIDLIEDFKRSPRNSGSIISLILDQTSENREQEIDFKTAGERLCTFIATGHQTLTTMLTWTWYLLSKHPDVEEKIRKELRAVVGEKAVTATDLPKMIYTEQVLLESLRLYPPVWHLPKRSVKSCEIGGYHIPGGTIVIVSQYFTHRHPDFWEQPEKFIPERFSPEKASKISPFLYFPFGAGPHHCVGQGLAMTQAKIIMSTIISKYRLSLSQEGTTDIDPRFELLPKSPIRMVFSSV